MTDTSPLPEQLQEPPQSVDPEPPRELAAFGPAPCVTDLFDPELAPADRWQKSTERALNKWSQGDLVQGVSLFWAGPDGADLVTGGDVESWMPGGWSVTEFEEDLFFDPPGDESTSNRRVSQPVRLGIITSQTCDVVATGVGAEHPTVQISPVVQAQIHFPNKISAIRNGEIGYLVQATNIPKAASTEYDATCSDLDTEIWVADLRISLPMSKAVLPPLTPRSAFVDEEGALRFAESLAAKAARPSLHEALSEKFLRVLQQAIKQARNDGDTGWLAGIEQLRLLITAGTRLDPQVVDPLVVFEGSLLAEARERWGQEIALAGKGTGVKHLIVNLPRFHEIGAMDVRTYRESVFVSLPLPGKRS